MLLQQPNGAVRWITGAGTDTPVPLDPAPAQPAPSSPRIRLREVAESAYRESGGTLHCHHADGRVEAAGGADLFEQEAETWVNLGLHPHVVTCYYVRRAFGQPIDRFIMGVIGTIASLPLLISAIILIYALDIRRGLPVFIVALSLVGWGEMAQYIRSEFMLLRRRPFIAGFR